VSWNLEMVDEHGYKERMVLGKSASF